MRFRSKKRYYIADKKIRTLIFTEKSLKPYNFLTSLKKQIVSRRRRRTIFKNRTRKLRHFFRHRRLRFHKKKRLFLFYMNKKKKPKRHFLRKYRNLTLRNLSKVFFDRPSKRYGMPKKLNQKKVKILGYSRKDITKRRFY